MKHPSLPHIALSDLAPHIETINRLADEGWQITMNHLGAQWHVGLTHQSLGVCEVRLHDDGSQTTSYDGTGLSIHARSRLLKAALAEALGQADAQPIPS